MPETYGSAGRESVYIQETQETQVPALGQKDPLEEEIATHSSILAWKIPRTEELGGLQSMGSQSQTWLKQLSMHEPQPQSLVPLAGQHRISGPSVGKKTIDSWRCLWIYLVHFFYLWDKETDAWRRLWIYLAHFLYPWDKETDAWERKGLLRPLVRARSGTLDSQSRTLFTASRGNGTQVFTLEWGTEPENNILHQILVALSSSDIL